MSVSTAGEPAGETSWASAVVTPSYHALPLHHSECPPPGTPDGPGDQLPCQSAGTGRSPRPPPQELARWLVATLDARLRVRGGGEWPWPPDRVRIPGLLRTARHTVNSSSCWPRTSIAASEGVCHRPTKPWSGPISRACPTSDRRTSTIERRRPSRSGFGRLGPAAGRSFQWQEQVVGDRFLEIEEVFPDLFGVEIRGLPPNLSRIPETAGDVLDSPPPSHR